MNTFGTIKQENNHFQGYESINWIECHNTQYKTLVQMLCKIATPINFKDFTLANNIIPFQYEIDGLIIEYTPRQINISINGIRFNLPQTEQELYKYIEIAKRKKIGESDTHRFVSNQSKEVKGALRKVLTQRKK